MRFEVLGRIRALIGEGEVAVTARRERTLLAMLLVHANRTVSSDELVDAIWPARPPRDARNQLHHCVMRLRRRLTNAGAGRNTIVTDHGGYRITVGQGRLDADVFRRLVADARAAREPEQAWAKYRSALALWRGPALADIDSPAMRPAATMLDDEHTQTTEDCIEVELSLGRARNVLPELRELTRRHPYRERLQGAYMLALYRVGRYADALDTYRNVRRVLYDELGAEPGRELQDLHKAILKRDPGLESPTPPAHVLPILRQPPAEVAGFTGRVEALKALDAPMPDGPDPSGSLVSVIARDQVGRTRALRWIARSRYEAGDVVRSVAPARQAAALAAGLGNRRALCEALFVQGEALRDLNRFDEAACVLTQALDLAVETADRNQEINLRAALGTTYNRAWEPHRALPVLRPALALLPGADDHQRIWTLHSLSLAYRLLGRRAEAMSLNTEMMQACQRAQYEFGLGHAFQDRGWIAYDEHRYDDAAAHMQAMLAVFQRVGNTSEVGFALEALGQIAIADGRPEDALGPLTAAIDQFQRLDNPLRVGRSQLYRAVALTNLGHLPEARTDWIAGDQLVGPVTMREAEPLRCRLRIALQKADRRA